ncbi:prepilin-type N-terminal cleavage/methylation domain-containing protein [bacterium]|nr:prepilin-type N-terminal cleavage/methylation domain-containing protein [bacterium]
MDPRRSQGFTLIELLVVIAIISILASILMPVYSNARAKGRQAACISNLHQICMAVSMYAQDFDECIVKGQLVAGDPQTQWYNGIFPYTHNRQIMFCPDRKDSGPGYGLSYYASAQSLGNFFDPAVKILVGDASPEVMNPNLTGDSKVATSGRWWINDANNDLAGHPPQDDSFIGNKYPQRHNDGLIFGYVDGHCKWAKEQSVDQKLCWDPAEPSS